MGSYFPRRKKHPESAENTAFFQCAQLCSIGPKLLGFFQNIGGLAFIALCPINLSKVQVDIKFFLKLQRIVQIFNRFDIFFLLKGQPAFGIQNVGIPRIELISLIDISLGFFDAFGLL